MKKETARWHRHKSNRRYSSRANPVRFPARQKDRRFLSSTNRQVMIWFRHRRHEQWSNTFYHSKNNRDKSCRMHSGKVPDRVFPPLHAHLLFEKKHRAGCIWWKVFLTWNSWAKFVKRTDEMKISGFEYSKSCLIPVTYTYFY